MSQLKKSYMQEIMVGLFMVAVLALLGFFTIVISGVDLVRGRQRVERIVRFENVGSLRTQDSVIVRGLPVGRVQSMKLADGAVNVTISIDSKVQLREGYQINVASASVLGGSRLEIDEGTGAVLPEDAVLRGEPATDLMRKLDTFISQLSASINVDDLKATISNLRTTTDAFSKMSVRLERGEGTLGKLLSTDATLYNDLQSTVASLRKLTTSLEKGEGTLGKLFTDQTVYNDLQGTLASTREIAARLKEGRGTIGKLLSEDETVYNDFAATMKNIRKVTDKFSGDDSQLIVNLEESAKSLKVVLGRMERGEGTLGKLMADETTAKEVEAAIKDVRQIIDNMRDTAPITTFTSLFFNGL